MRKRFEVVEGCMAKAFDHEPTFVLLARDKSAPDTIRFWAESRIAAGKNSSTDKQIVEALAIADVMEDEQEMWSEEAHKTTVQPDAETEHAYDPINQAAWSAYCEAEKQGGGMIDRADAVWRAAVLLTAQNLSSAREEKDVTMAEPQPQHMHAPASEPAQAREETIAPSKVVSDFGVTAQTFTVEVAQALDNAEKHGCSRVVTEARMIAADIDGHVLSQPAMTAALRTAFDRLRDTGMLHAANNPKNINQASSEYFRNMFERAEAELLPTPVTAVDANPDESRK